MSNWWFKSCPKCRGDLTEERSLGGEREVTCLQCGYVLRPIETAALRPAQSGLRAVPSAVRRAARLTRAA